MAIYFKAANTF